MIGSIHVIGGPHLPVLHIRVVCFARVTPRLDCIHVSVIVCSLAFDQVSLLTHGLVSWPMHLNMTLSQLIWFPTAQLLVVCIHVFVIACSLILKQLSLLP